MSLRVWLPLISDLHNQGVSGLTPVQTTAPTWVDGKLGKAMSTGALYLPANDVAKFYNNNAMSFAFWIYAVGSSGSSVILGQSNMSVGNNRMFTIFQYPSPNDLHLSWQSNESSTTFLGGTLYGVFPSGTWTHCAITYDGAKATVYINGVYQTSWNGVSTRTNFTYDVPIPSTSIRYLNDFRIYDHALSPKEVKVISQGLVAHYQLNGDGRGLPNLLRNTNFYAGTSNWYGVNNSAPRIAVVEGRNTITGTKGTSNNIAGQTMNTSDYSYVADTNITFTISADVYVEVEGRISVGNWISSPQATGWQGISFTEIWNTPRDLHLGWNHISVTHKDAHNQYSGSIVTAFGYSEATMYFTNVKFEMGDKSTAWIPNVADTIYQTLGYSENIVYDSSGYNYHGTRSGTLTVDSNTPRYSVSTQFGSGSHIYTPTINTSGFANSFTFAWWGYIVNYTGHMMWGFSNGNRLNLYMSNSGNNFYWNTGDGNNNVLGNVKPSDYKNAWHYFAMTGDGTKAKLYIDGEYVASATTYKAVNGTIIYMNGWDSSTSYNCNGKISDFRIYATTLSAEDIKALYQIGASIDKDGNMYAYEFNEV